MLNSEINNSYQDIWQKFIEGDDEALSCIYFEFFDLLLNFGMKYSSDRFVVEDCIQNLFLDLLKNRKNQKSVQNLRFYLTKALRNQMLNEFRKSQKIIPVDQAEESDFRIIYSIENSLIADETDEIRLRFLKMVMEELTNRQKEILYLKFNCGFDYGQIAELMHISVNSARTLIYRTLKSIKDNFGSEKHTILFFFSILRNFFNLSANIN